MNATLIAAFLNERIGSGNWKFEDAPPVVHDVTECSVTVQAINVICSEAALTMLKLHDLTSGVLRVVDEERCSDHPQNG